MFEAKVPEIGEKDNLDVEKEKQVKEKTVVKEKAINREKTFEKGKGHHSLDDGNGSQCLQKHCFSLDIHLKTGDATIFLAVKIHATSQFM